jgi:hypothetical protein
MRPVDWMVGLSFRNTFDRAGSDILLLSRLGREGLDDSHVLHQPWGFSALRESIIAMISWHGLAE